MEQNNTTTAPAPQGKGMGVAGFVISLIALVFWFIIAGICAVSALVGGGMGLAMFWLVLSLLGAGLSVMGMMKLGKTGGKKGLAITGMILGIVAVILSIMTIMGVSETKAKVGDKFGDALKNGMEALSDTAKLRETINNAVQQATDTLNAH
jgi:hypothetical protein